MNWFKKISSPSFDWDAKYPRAGNEVDGLIVGSHVSNMASIEAGFYDYKILPGVREVPIWEGATGANYYYAANDRHRVQSLAEEIKASGRIDPLIVSVNDNDDLDIVEGGHRLSALVELGKRAFPAVIVVNYL